MINMHEKDVAGQYFRRLGVRMMYGLERTVRNSRTKSKVFSSEDPFMINNEW